MPEYSDRVGRMLAELTDEEMTQLIGVVGRSAGHTLTKKQWRRVECLRIAREVLVGDQPTLSVGIVQAQAAAKVDPFDLIAVAEYLELGTQPRPLRMVDDEEFTNALLDAQTWEQP